MKNVTKILFSLLMIIKVGDIDGATYTTISNGLWNDLIWSPSGTPGVNDEVIINHTVLYNSGTVTYNGKITINIGGKLTISTGGGTFTLNNKIELKGQLIINGPFTMINSSKIEAKENSKVEINGMLKMYNNSKIETEIETCGNFKVLQGMALYGPGVKIEGEDDEDVTIITPAVVYLSGATVSQIEDVNISSSCALPVEMVSFTAEVKKETVEIKWTTFVEINNEYFLVQKSIDGKKWLTIDTVKGNGNSSEHVDYISNDLNPTKGENYYRLLQKDFDGKFEITEVIAVTYEIEITKTKVFPIPSNGLVNVISNKNQLVTIFNIMGTKVKEEIMQEGNNTITYLKTGVYFLNTEKETIKIIIK